METVCVKIYGVEVFEVSEINKRDVVNVLRKCELDLRVAGKNIGIMIVWIHSESYYVTSGSSCVVEISGVRANSKTVKMIEDSLNDFFVRTCRLENVVYLSKN